MSSSIRMSNAIMTIIRSHCDYKTAEQPEQTEAGSSPTTSFFKTELNYENAPQSRPVRRNQVEHPSLSDRMQAQRLLSYTQILRKETKKGLSYVLRELPYQYIRPTRIRTLQH